jgi:HSP20 family molecular chaperone IbpA
MSQVRICKVQEESGLKSAIERIRDRVRTRAYELFEHRGRTDGHSLDDWLDAENQLLGHPPIELTETDQDLRLSVDAPGFSAKELQIGVLPDSISIVGEHEQPETRDHEEETCALVAQMELPCPIDPNHVDAKLRHQKLEIVAKKAQQRNNEAGAARKVFAA